MVKDCHVGVKALLIAEGKCLLVKRAEATTIYWDAPGGRIDDEEKLMDTLKRELYEELPSLGDYKIHGIVGAYRFFKKNFRSDRGLILLFYKVTTEWFDVVLSEEHTEYLWVGKENLNMIKDPEFSIDPELRSLVEEVIQ